MLKRHRSLFPFLIALLTLGLIGFMVFAFRGSAPNANDQTSTTPSPSSETIDQPVVDAEQYRGDLAQVMRPFYQTLNAAQTGEEIQSTAQQTLSGVLSLRVPSEFRDLHLQVASNLNVLIKASDPSSEAFASAGEQLEALQTTYPWLKP